MGWVVWEKDWVSLSAQEGQGLHHALPCLLPPQRVPAQPLPSVLYSFLFHPAMPQPQPHPRCTGSQTKACSAISRHLE